MRSSSKPKPELFDYGIHGEDSHVRVHVCPAVKRIYVYPTTKGIEALGNGKKAYGYQPGVDGPTAKGHRLPRKTPTGQSQRRRYRGLSAFR